MGVRPMDTNAIKNPVVIISALLVVFFFLPWFGIDLAELGGMGMAMISGMSGAEMPEVDMEQMEALPAFSLSGWDIGTIPLLGLGFLEGWIVTLMQATGESIDDATMEQIRAQIDAAPMPSSVNLALVLLASPILALLAVIFGFLGGPVRIMAFLSGLIFVLVFILMFLAASEIMAFASFGLWLTLIAAIALLITPFMFKRQ